MSTYQFENCNITFNQSPTTAKALEEDTTTPLLNNEVTALKAKLAITEDKLNSVSTNEETESFIDELRGNISKLRDLVVKKQDELKKANNTIDTFNNVKLDYERKLKLSNDRVIELEANIASIKLADNQSDDVKILKDKNVSLSNANLDLNSTISKLNDRIKQLETSNANLAESVKDCNSKKEGLTPVRDNAEVKTELQTAKPIRKIKRVSLTPLPEIKTKKLILIKANRFQKNDKFIDYVIESQERQLLVCDDLEEGLNKLRETNTDKMYNSVNGIDSFIIKQVGDIEYKIKAINVMTNEDYRIQEAKFEEALKLRVANDTLPIQTEGSISIAHPHLSGFKFKSLDESATRINSKMLYANLSKLCTNVDKEGYVSSLNIHVLDDEFQEEVLMYDDLKFIDIMGMESKNHDLAYAIAIELKSVVELENDFGKSAEDIINEVNKEFPEDTELEEGNIKFEDDVLNSTQSDEDTQEDEKEAIETNDKVEDSKELKTVVEWNNIKLPTNEMLKSFKEANPKGRAGLKKVLTYQLGVISADSNDNIEIINNNGGITKLSKMSGVKLEKAFRNIMIEIDSSSTPIIEEPTKEIDNSKEVSDNDVKKAGTLEGLALDKFQESVRLDVDGKFSKSSNYNFVMNSKVLDVKNLHTSSIFREVALKLLPIGGRAIFIECEQNLGKPVSTWSDNDLLICYKYVINTVLS